mgnify:FL=1
MATIAAGAVMNLVLGFILSLILLLVEGGAVSTQIVWFAEDAASSRYGLQLGDKITDHLSAS